MTDPYQTLGIPRTATVDEAKAAYRRLARKYHPDVSKEPNAEERFKDVQAAWEAIKNPQAGPRGSAGRANSRAPENFEDIMRRVWTPENFENIYRNFGGQGGGFTEARYERVMNINLTLEQAYTGAVQNIGGVQVRLPPGVRTGTRVRPHGHDVTLVVNVLPHRRFQRNGDDLLVNIHVGMAEAVLGCTVRTSTVTGSTLEVKIPGGIQNGQTVRLQGQGMPNPAQSHHRGDLFLQVFVDTPDPKNLTDEQRQFLENNFNYQRTLNA